MAGASRSVVQVEGVRELRRELKEAGDDMGDLKAANAEVARIVEPVARVAAPVVSGRLAASVRGTGSASGATVRAGGTTVPYANPIHWGWPARNIKPQRFIYDTAKATQPRWLDTYRDAIQKILDRVKGDRHG